MRVHDTTRTVAYRFASVALIGLIVLFAAAIVLLVWPYDKASFKGEGQIVGPKVITPGSTIMIEWESFCAQGVDLYYERWADVYDEHDEGGELIYSYGIPPFIAYHNVDVCSSPAVGPLTLPNYLPPGNYRIRFSVSYHPNFLREVTITTQTEEFTIIPKADGTTPIAPK